MALFRRRKAAPTEVPTVAVPAGVPTPRDASGFGQVAVPSVATEANPLAGAQVSSQIVLDKVMQLMTTENGVHVESVVTALGALAGRACQIAAIHQLEQTGDATGVGVSRVVTTSGETYLMGDAINRPLLESPYSVWSLVSGAAKEQGAELPELTELVSHSASTLGGPEFGIPRFAEGTDAAASPREYLELWNTMLTWVTPTAPRPQQWPMVYGLALQNLFQMMRGQDFDLGVLTRVAMDSALTTAKIATA